MPGWMAIMEFREVPERELDPPEYKIDRHCLDYCVKCDEALDVVYGEFKVLGDEYYCPDCYQRMKVCLYCEERIVDGEIKDRGEYFCSEECLRASLEENP